ncbi:MAG: hypothetical protein OER88_13995, partial [Planctomycetota bacterium]|nr:hypothetical protein [Planctomycetota bacterium]
MRHLHKPLLIATALVLLASSARAEDQTFSDGEFFIVDWTQAILINPSGTFTFTTERRATGGNPGAFRRITHDRVGGSGSSSVAHFRVGMVFDPSTDGAIETVDWQLEARVGAATSGGVGYGPLIRQGGLRFYAIGDVILTGTGWRPAIEFGLTANDFIADDGSAAKPDFSTSGGPIEFGFFSTNGAGNAGFSSASSVDNWNVTVHCDPDFQL